LLACTVIGKAGLYSQNGLVKENYIPLALAFSMIPGALAISRWASGFKISRWRPIQSFSI
jgi:hypothetical protein